MNFTGSTHSSTLVFIDSNVTDINHLLTGLASNTEVITLDTTRMELNKLPKRSQNEKILTAFKSFLTVQTDSYNSAPQH